MVSEKKNFLSFSYYKSMGANPTKYISSGLYGFREEDFLSFSHYKSVRANDP